MLQISCVEFRGLLSFDETLKGDVDSAKRVLTGKPVEDVRLGRLNEAGNKRIFETWASRCTRLEEATENMAVQMPRNGNMVKAFECKERNQRLNSTQSLTRKRVDKDR